MDPWAEGQHRTCFERDSKACNSPGCQAAAPMPASGGAGRWSPSHASSQPLSPQRAARPSPRACPKIAASGLPLKVGLCRAPTAPSLQKLSATRPAATPETTPIQRPKACRGHCAGEPLSRNTWSPYGRARWQPICFFTLTPITRTTPRANAAHAHARALRCALGGPRHKCIRGAIGRV